MSGGAFDYAYFRTEQFVDDLGDEMKKNHIKDKYGYSTDFSEATINQLKIIRDLCKEAAFLMREAEWLYSSDTGEDSFAKRIEEHYQGDEPAAK
jgi:hypothetical protein